VKFSSISTFLWTGRKKATYHLDFVIRKRARRIGTIRLVWRHEPVKPDYQNFAV
jgi:hypothetical protein